MKVLVVSDPERRDCRRRLSCSHPPAEVKPDPGKLTARGKMQAGGMEVPGQLFSSAGDKAREALFCSGSQPGQQMLWVTPWQPAGTDIPGDAALWLWETDIRGIWAHGRQEFSCTAFLTAGRNFQA